ncbi:hypothetical protein ACJ4V0_16915 [Phreatobacter sp. HK31-P]
MTQSSHMAVGASASSSAGFSRTIGPKFPVQSAARRPRPQERADRHQRPIAGWARAFLREGL